MAETSVEAWAILRGLYETNNFARIMLLQHQLHNLELKEGDSVHDHITKVKVPYLFVGAHWPIVCPPLVEIIQEYSCTHSTFFCFHLFLVISSIVIRSLCCVHACLFSVIFNKAAKFRTVCCSKHGKISAWWSSRLNMNQEPGEG